MYQCCSCNIDYFSIITINKILLDVLNNVSVGSDSVAGDSVVVGGALELNNVAIATLVSSLF